MAISRGTWTVERKIVGVWTNIGTIYRPNSNLSVNNTSNQIKTKLADGSIGYLVPEVKSTADPLMLTWGYLPKTYKDQLDEYSENLYDLRITDHNATIYYGRFTNVKSTWLVGEADKYDVSAEFEIMPGLE